MKDILNNKKKMLYEYKKCLLLALYTIYLSNSITSTTIVDDDNLVTESTQDIESNDVSIVNEDVLLTTTGNNLDLDNATYYNFPCTKELQNHIFYISKEYNVPYDIMMTIIHQESGGKWDTNGVISSTNDYGLTQINECNLDQIYENIGITKEEVLYNPFKAVEAQAYLLKNIIDMYDYDNANIDYKNVFGTYNGWINWEDKEMSCKYANSCMEILEEKFGITNSNYTKKQVLTNNN